MMKRTVLFLVFVLGAACSPATEVDLTAVSSLKVDLDAVVELGQVYPVDGITSAGQPDEAGFRVFAQEGYVAVVDIRTDEEDRGLDEPATVEQLGMEYISFPIGRDDITLEKAAELNAVLARYDEPVLVHCASANRVGALFALQTFSETGDAELALEAGREGGMTRLEDTVKEVIESR